MPANGGYGKSVGDFSELWRKMSVAALKNKLFFRPYWDAGDLKSTCSAIFSTMGSMRGLFRCRRFRELYQSEEGWF
jgi:hypothetical protein